MPDDDDDQPSVPEDELFAPAPSRFTSLKRPALPARVIGMLAAAVVGLALVVVVVTHHDQLTAVFGGIGTGALYAAIALGVVLTFKGSGVVNFANGATAMYVAYIYNDLRTHGEVFLPPLPNPLGPVEGLLHTAGATGVSLPDWPTHLGSGTPMAAGPAMVIALLAAIVLGLLFHALVFRPLRDAPRSRRSSRRSDSSSSFRRSSPSASRHRPRRSNPSCASNP